MTRALAIAGVLGACALALLLTGAGGEDKDVRTYKIVFDNAFGLVEGGDLKIGGVKAGQTTGFELTDDEPRKVAVEIEVTEPGFQSLRTDATCAVRQQSLIGEYFVDCDLGRSKEELPDGGTVPVKQTSSTIPPDLINNVMRRPYRERFRLIISELGTGLAGRPQDLQAVIRRAHPALRETSETFKILAEQNETIKQFIENSDRVSEAVEPRREDVARWARESSETATIQASRARQLARYWNRLPRFLAELEPTAAELEKTAREQVPTLQKLGGAAPQLTDFLEELGPFARASRTSLRSLGPAAEVGRRAFEKGADEIKVLRALSEDAPRLGRPLRQFLQTIDDRGRSIENDPQTKHTSPPPPDKTAYQEGKGYTGMEALLNYVYYQTLGINAFDQIGHVLRIGLLQSPVCDDYVQRPSQRQKDECGGGLLGPYQPGVDPEDPDPTLTGTAERERRERRATDRGERAPAGGDEAPASDRRGRGEPEAPPVPGQRDLSKPQIALPPQVQQLLDEVTGKLPKEDLPKLPGSEQQSLLDFLMAP